MDEGWHQLNLEIMFASQDSGGLSTILTARGGGAKGGRQKCRHTCLIHGGFLAIWTAVCSGLGRRFRLQFGGGRKENRGWGYIQHLLRARGRLESSILTIAGGPARFFCGVGSVGLRCGGESTQSMA